MISATVSTPIDASDEQLIARFRAGDRGSLEELFRRYRGLAYRVAYRLLGNDADALDAVQDGFIKALKNLAGFEGRSTFKTWLLRVVSNASLDIGRQRGRREAASLQSLDTHESEIETLLVYDNLAEKLEQQELRHLLCEALSTLPEAQRRTFVLHVDGELNYREVAEALGISIGTVMSRLFYTRKKLQAYLSRRIEK